MTLANPGPSPVSVDGIDGPCDWKQSGLTLPLVIGAGDRYPLRLVLTPGTTSECGRAKGGERFAPTLTVFYSAGGERKRQAWQLRGVLKPTLHFVDSPDGVLRVGEQTADRLAEPRDLPLAATVPVESVAVSGGRWLGDVRRAAEPGRFIVAVRYVPGPESHPFDEVVTFTPKAADGRTLPATRLRLVGEQVERVVAVPRAVRLGRRPVGSTATDVFTLRSVDGQAVAVGRIEPADGLQVRQLDGPVPAFEVTAVVAQVGERELTLVVHTTGPDGTPTAVRVPVSYLGYTP